MESVTNQSTAAAAGSDIVDPGLGPKNPTIAADRRVALPHVANGSTVSTPQNTAKNRPGKPTDTAKPDRVERIIVGIVLFVLGAVPLLTFLFSFGNVGDLGQSLGVDKRIAYLTGPGVDLTATGMIVAATWLSYRGMSERELWRVHTLSIVCALIMFALNCGPAMYAHRYQLAGFSAVGPFLLMAMGYVGPWLLRQLTDDRAAPAPETAPARPARSPGTPAWNAPAPKSPAPASYAVTAASGTGTPGGTMPPVPDVDSGSGTESEKPASGSNRRSPEEWAELAKPLWLAYTDRHGDMPTAPVLANLLRNAHPELKTGESERWERNVRAAVEKLFKDEVESCADDDERSEVSR